MASQTVVMPQLGESVMEGVVIKWLVQAGEKVEVDAPLVEVETDKATVEIPSPMAGYIAKFLADIDAVVEVGNPLMEISSEPVEGVPATQEQAPTASAPTEAAAATPATPAAPAAPVAPAAPAASASNGAGMPGAQDLLKLIQSVGAAPAAPAAPAPKASSSSKDRWLPFGHPEGARAYRYPQPRVEEGDVVEKFSRRRQIISEHMVVSQTVSPHVVTVAEVDMTDVVKLRNKHKGRLKAQGIGLTFLTFVLKATVEALMEFPVMNSVVGDRQLIRKKNINLGCAVETPQGLVVPVIKNANRLNVVGLSMTLARLAAKARDGKLEPDDVNGGTFTVTNPGRRGNLYGGAIINQPQIGIVRMGEIKKRPMVIQSHGEDVIAIRSMMYIALSYDHRVVDGVIGNSFLFRIRELLEQADFHV